MNLGVVPLGRQTKFAGLELRTVAGDGFFTGYASLFGAVDLGRDVVERGAFAASLAARGPSAVRMLYQHDPAEPIGTWSVIREDGRGLYVEGRLAAGVARAREVHGLMKAGALDGLSIGFEAVRARTDPATGLRHILEADLWEISVVTFPMLPGARVTHVKRLPAVCYPAKRDPRHRPGRKAGLQEQGLAAVIRACARRIQHCSRG